MDFFAEVHQLEQLQIELFWMNSYKKIVHGFMYLKDMTKIKFFIKFILSGINFIPKISTLS